MSKVIKWKIYYDNREPFSSREGTPEESPLDGVMVIVQWRENGVKEILHANDYFVWLGKEWRDINLAGLERWLRREVPQIKFGRWVDAQTWKEIKDLVLHARE